MLIGHRKEFFKLASRRLVVVRAIGRIESFVVLESNILVEFKNLEVRK